MTRRYTKWTPREEELLRARLAEGVSQVKIAEELGKPIKSVHSKVCNLGLLNASRELALDLEGEVWRNPPGLRARYLVSNLGRCKNADTGFLLRTQMDGNGYASIKLDGKTHRLHILVMTAFSEKPAFADARTEVNHQDGDKMNPALRNLEWCTTSQNVVHAIETGLMSITKGVDHYNATIDEEIVHEICRLRQSGMMPGEIARRLQVSRDIVKNISRRSTWKHISKLYTW